MSHVDCSSRQRLSQDFWQGAFWSEATESAICCASEAARSAADQTTLLFQTSVARIFPMGPLNDSGPKNKNNISMVHHWLRSR